MSVALVLLAVVIFIVIATSKFKLHPFITLIAAAIMTAFGFGLPANDIAGLINSGFGGTLKGIGLIIVLGTIIGTILEKSGAAITMADAIIRRLGKRFPTLTMSIIGYIVSIPVFCDSGFVILNSLKQSLANRMRVSSVAMSVALATGLFATHTFVPPTPGPIAAANNLNLDDNLGLVIGIGIIVSIVTAIAGLLWANRFKNVEPDGEGAEELISTNEDYEKLKASYGKLPSTLAASAPIFVPIILICLGSIAKFPSHPFGETSFLYDIFTFFGQPLNALIIGLIFSLFLLKKDNKVVEFSERITQGLVVAAPIILITGAGGALGNVIKQIKMDEIIKVALSNGNPDLFVTYGIGIFLPFLISAALKSAQGSSTVALVTTSAIVAPLLASLGLDSEMGRVLTVMAIGAGAMTVSHANDSFFWVVTQFSRMSVSQAYKAQTMATLIQGVTGIIFVWILSLILL